MAEYIDLNNTEVLAEAGENAKLVVEEDGELKRIPASAVGQVKTVNGVEPDEAGNVGVSYNNLLGKPFSFPKDALIVNSTWNDNFKSISFDKTFDEVYAAYDAGRQVYFTGLSLNEIPLAAETDYESVAQVRSIRVFTYPEVIQLTNINSYIEPTAPESPPASVGLGVTGYMWSQYLNNDNVEDLKMFYLNWNNEDGCYVHTGGKYITLAST